MSEISSVDMNVDIWQAPGSDTVMYGRLARIARGLWNFIENMTGPPAVMPLTQEEEDEERALLRVKRCGRPIVYTTAAGEIAEGTYQCGDIVRCPYCLRRRAKRYRDQVDQAWANANGDLVVTFLTDEEARKITRGQDKSTYIKMPTTDGVLFIGQADVKRFGKIESDLTIDNIDWLEIARTPTGRRPSGSLGKPVIVASDNADGDEEAVTCVTLSVVLNFDGADTSEKTISEIKKDAVLQAKIETGHMCPSFDGEQLTKARTARTLAYVYELRRYGVKVMAKTWKQEKVRFSLYKEWSTYELTVTERIDRLADRLGCSFDERARGILSAFIGGTPSIVPIGL